jgi:flagellar basal-body rod modification protein FlgD
MSTTAPVTTTNTAATSGTSGTSGTGDAMSQLSGNFDTFLTLLTTQLKNQDPTSPMDSSTFTQQLVEYSQVEQQINTNTNLQTLITQGQSNGSAMATSYLGKNVTVTGGAGALSQGKADWNYTLGTDAASTQLSVTDASGTVVYSGAGETAAGAHSFAWNGVDNTGNQLADGTYTLTATALASNGSAITTNVTSTGAVDEINMTGNAPQLMIGPMSIPLSQVSNVTN